MVRHILATGLTLAALAACDGGGTETKTKQVTAANPYVEQLRKLTPMNQGLALRRAVQDSNQACKRVVSSLERENYKNMSVWNLRCTDGEYTLFIAPSGDVQVRTCQDAKTLGLPQCRFEDAPAEETKKG